MNEVYCTMYGVYIYMYIYIYVVYFTEHILHIETQYTK